MGLKELLRCIAGIVSGEIITKPYRAKREGMLQRSLDEISSMILKVCPGLPNADWVAMRMLEGDSRIREALLNGDLAALAGGER